MLTLPPGIWVLHGSWGIQFVSLKTRGARGPAGMSVSRMNEPNGVAADAATSSSTCPITGSSQMTVVRAV
jgi:hypothetical protein